jgi:4-amino-4-deoxychorismate lyase
MRAVILKEAAAQNEAVVQGRYSVDEFTAADEVFFCNSVNGVWPVRTLATRSWLPGPVTRYWQAYWQRCLSSQ